MSKAPNCKKCGGPCRAGELTAQRSPVEAAHAAGRADERADVVADLEGQWFELATIPRPGKALALLRAAIVRLKDGAHVGAAKKGAE